MNRSELNNQNEDNTWVKSFPGAITVCDVNGIVLEMNKKSEIIFEEDGGKDLIGTNLMSCHPGPARAKLDALLNNGKINIYTIEKKGKKKLIYQAPWYKDGIYAGFVELSLEIPFDIPHFFRE